MSVFTALTANDIRRFLSTFEVGGLIDWQGVPGGSENTNYFLNCDSGGYVLTLIERGPRDNLSFFIELLEQLHQAHLPVPYAIADRHGERLHDLKGKPALLQPRFRGEHRMEPGPKECAAVGSMLARLHDGVAGSDLSRASDRGPAWVLTQARALIGQVWQGEKGWLEPVIDALQEWLDGAPRLPGTLIHGDLFRDNVLFDGTRITGVIDFYNAASGWNLLDLAICHNDWCMDSNGRDEVSADPRRAAALLEAYQGLRPFEEEERKSWPMMLQLAALRFWTSRELARMQHADQVGVLVKDPSRFRRILRHYCTVPVRSL
ncbi:MAG: homoserine kinase [Pseudohongiellaceae bacterium]